MTAQRPSRRALLAGAAFAAVRAPLGAQTPIKLLVATAPTDSGLGPVIGQRSGAYRRNGLEVEVQFMNSGAAGMAAVVGGAVQTAQTSLMQLVTAHVKGIPLQIVAPTTIYLSEKPGEELLVRKESPIQRAADLNGKTISSPSLGDLLSTATLAWIDQNGGDSKTVRAIEVPGAATLAALAGGRIDAAAMNEPRLSEALLSGNFRSIGKPYDAIAPRFLITGFVATADYVASHRDTIERFARAHREVNAFANAHPDQTAQWLAEVAKIEPAAIGRGRREIFTERFDLADVQRVVDAAARFHTIERTYDAREIVAATLLTLK